MTIRTDIICRHWKVHPHGENTEEFLLNGDSGDWSKFCHENLNPNFAQKGCIVVKKLTIGVHLLYLN